MRIRSLHLLLGLLFSAIASGPLRAQPIEWEPTEGPLGGSISFIAPDVEGRLHAVGRYRAYRLLDDGGGWEEARPTPLLYTCRVTLDSIIYAGTTDGIYRSLDNETSWDRIGFAGKHVYGIWAIGDSTLYVHVADGPYGKGFHRSKDSARSWKRLGAIDSYDPATVSSSGVIYARTESSKLHRSFDEGETWQGLLWIPQIPYGEGPSNSINSIAITRWGGVLAATDREIYRHDNDPGTWDPNDWHTIPIPTYQLYRFSDTIIFATTKDHRIVRSTDEGTTWTTSVAANASSFYATGDTLYAATQHNGVIRTTDLGETWETVNSGIREVEVSALLLTPSGYLVAGAGAVMYRSADHGNTWTRIWSKRYGVTGMTSTPEGYIYAGSSGSIYEESSTVSFEKSPDEGTTWRTPQPIYYSEGTISITAGSDGLVLAAMRGFLYSYSVGEVVSSLYISTDYGASWNHSLQYKGAQSSIILSPRRYLCHTGLYGCLETTDGGKSWKPCISGLAGVPFTSLTTTASGTMLVMAGNHTLHRSTDHGTNWNLIDGVRARKMAINPVGVIYAIDDSMAVSTDEGATWKSYLLNVDSLPVLSFAFDREGYAYAGTSHSVYRSKRSTMSVAPSPEGKAVALFVGPNPAEDHTDIRLFLPRPAYVRLNIIDYLGRTALTVYEGRSSEGEHKFATEVADLPSGIYFVELATDGERRLLPLIVRR